MPSLSMGSSETRFLARLRAAGVLFFWVSLALTITVFPRPVLGQVASPLQSGHYSPVMMNVRDMAQPPAGLFVLWYNAFTSSDKFIDRHGDKFERINLSAINGNLPDIEVDLALDAFAAVPTVFWASEFRVLGGARYMAGIAPSYISADVSLFTERRGIANPDTSIIRNLGDTSSGFSDLFVTPLGLSWGWE